MNLSVSHLDPDVARRVLQTIACRDTDTLPKVPGAGDVVELDGKAVQRMHNGLLVEEGCYYGPWMTEIIRGLNGHHEPQEEVVFAELLERLGAAPEQDYQPVIVELGSFWAYYSMWFLRRWPSGRAVCMEPDLNYLDVGRRNFALNSLAGEFIHGIVGANPGRLTEFIQESNGETTVVEQHDLASLFAAARVEIADLVMVDIQGAETDLLERAGEVLRSGRVRYLVVSTHHHSISESPVTHQTAVDALRRYGGQILVEHSVSESFSGDGLVVAGFTGAAEQTIEISYARSKNTLFGELEWALESAMQARDRAVEERERACSQVGELALRLEAAEERCRSLDAEIETERSRRGSVEQSLVQIRNSRSWRLTGIVRTTAERVRVARKSG